MDSAENDPLGPKSVFGSNWAKKKSRYDDDELSMSPPADDSSFFSLRYGLQRKPNESMYDRINKELGLTVESGPKNHLTPELNIAPASTFCDGKHTELLLGPGGFKLETTIRPQSHTAVSVVPACSTNDSPKIVIPSTILERQEKPEDSLVAHQDVETLVKKVRGGRPTRKISMNLADTVDRKFLENIQELRIENPQIQEQPTPHCSLISPGSETPSIASCLIDSLPVVTGIRDRRRKTSAPPSLNPMKASNFFFTGGLFSSVNTSTASTLTTSEAAMSVSQQITGLSPHTAPAALSQPTSPMRQIETEGINARDNLTLAQTTLLMEQNASEAAAFEQRDKIGGKRRPKASALREMNFWAPQSM
ncbi:UNVERIFIED_CONTAM: hypothetical protein RMT77_009318 [Armadillidium vulgare]